MGIILNIETATKWCSVALSKDGIEVIQKEAFDDAYIHSEKLHLFIDEILTVSGISYQELSAVAVSAGPGSYTGLRIGVATAKGICAGLDIPLITIDTLQALTFQATDKLKDQNKVISDAIFYPMIDARRMEVFYAVYDENKKQIAPLFNMIFDEELTIEYPEFYFFGDGAFKGKEILEKIGGTIIDDVYCSASNLVELAYQKFKSNEFASLMNFEPNYGKEFLAGKAKKIF